MTAKKPTTFPLYINGQYVQTATLRPVNDPAGRTGAKSLCFVGPEDAELIEAALAGATLSFEQVQAGSFFPLHERLDFLKRLQTKIGDQADNLAELLVMEIGKPLKAARAEVARCQATIEWTRIEAAKFFSTEGLPVEADAGWAGLWGWKQRFGRGPLVAITPFNFPLNLAMHKIAPAIAAGCPVIFKPSPKGALCGLTLVDLCHAVGIPAGMMSLLNTSDNDTRRILADSRIKHVSFTGSAKVGKILQAVAPDKPLHLELGGTGPTFVAADADLDLAAEKCLAAGYGYAGQVCIALQNLHVESSVAKPFFENLGQRVQALAWGDPQLEETVAGPLIDRAAAERVAARFAAAIAHGGEQIAEAAGSAPSTATYVKPALFRFNNFSPNDMNEELFGPGVFGVEEESFASFVGRANSYPARFQASLFTRDARLVQTAQRSLDYGAVIVNDANSLRLEPMPFGGNGDAGNAREGPYETLLAFTQAKTLLWRV